MTDIEYILEFAVGMGKKMISNGANKERADDTMYRICVSYDLKDISIFSLTTNILLSARTEEGEYAERYIHISSTANKLEKLNRLNSLSRKVCSEKPEPKTLPELLENAEGQDEYPWPITMLGYMLSMMSICVMFGGGIGDVAAVWINTFILYTLIQICRYTNVNHMITNILCMFVAGSLAVLYTNLGLGTHYSVIIATNSMMLIPGIPMVNGVRNLLCGNEMNGIIEILKAVLETIAIVLGLVLAIFVFKRFVIW